MIKPVVSQIEVGPMANFAYVVACPETHEAILVDPVAEPERLLGELERLSATLIAVVNTHGHVDHIGGNAAIKRKTGVPIITHADVRLDRLDPLSQQILGMLGGEPSPPADRTVTDGEVIEIGKVGLQALHTPGHTPGDMCLYVPGSVLTGDTLFVGGVGRTDLPGSSAATLAKSLRERLATLPDDTVVYPGHNYGAVSTSTIGTEKATNPFLQAALDPALGNPFF